MIIKPTIILADDHPLLLSGLKDHLVKNHYDVVAAVKNGKEALEAILQLKPDISILDIEMPELSGLDVAKSCRTLGSSTKIILLSYHKEIAYVAKAKELNVMGYLVKDDTMSSIEQCLKSVCHGIPYFSKPLEAMDTTAASNNLNRINQLSPSERKILVLISESKSTEDIANTLFISRRTVEKHRSNIITKLDIQGKTNGLLKWTLKNKMLIQKADSKGL